MQALTSEGTLACFNHSDWKCKRSWNITVSYHHSDYWIESFTSTYFCRREANNISVFILHIITQHCKSKHRKFLATNVVNRRASYSRWQARTHDHWNSLLHTIHQVNRNLDIDFFNDSIWKLGIGVWINRYRSHLGITKTSLHLMIRVLAHDHLY